MKTWVLRFRKIDKSTFDAIANGTKSIETRAATIKYKNISQGDVLIFRCSKEEFEKQVKKVHHFSSIEELLNHIAIKKIMPTIETINEARKIYYSFPGYEQKITENGLIALELE
jgi:ASC-1-like (ASCH) protein